MLAPGLNPDKGRLHAEAEAFEYVASLQTNMSLLAPRRLQAERILEWVAISFNTEIRAKDVYRFIRIFFQT